MPIKFLASGRFSSSSKLDGTGKVSVLAFFILLRISSSLSVKLILLRSDISDLLIFFKPSLRLIILENSFWIKGSGILKKLSTLKS